MKRFIKKFPNYIFLNTYFVFQTISRILLASYALYAKQISLLHLPFIFSLGFINDFIAAIYLLPLILLPSVILNWQPKRHTTLNYLSITAYGIYVFILLFTLIAEMTFWEEYGTKFNFIAVDYLIYTNEIIGTLQDSLPVKTIIGTMLLFVIVITWLVRQKLANNIKFSNKLFNGWLIVGCAISILILTKQYNSTTTFFSNNRYANELTLNGPYEFFKAFLNNSLDYNKFYTTLNSDVALELAKTNVLEEGQEFLDNHTLSRLNTPKLAEKKYNIILITVESLSAEFLGYFGNKKNITPNLDRLIQDSLVFNNIYATGTRTVRGLEALTLSLPPTPGSSIIRRPDNGNLFNIGSVFNQKNYDVKFVFGGYSYFDNLKNYFINNKFQILDRSDLRIEEISFSNVWGVADEDIFSKALQAADNAYTSNKPFFQLVMTTSNHRPYTFPEGRIDLPSGGGRDAAVKYTDYAIGEFINKARGKKWFDNTIFVITADHCASSAGKTDLPIQKYHVPLIIYAPKLIKPAIITSLASQIDIPPTILGLLNFKYKSKFYGKNILHSPPNRAFISTYQLLGYLKNNNLVILAPNKKPEQYKVEGSKLIKATNDIQMVQEAISFYQTADEFYKNGTLKESP